MEQSILTGVNEYLDRENKKFYPKLILLLSTVCSVIMYIARPHEVVMLFNYFCFALFLTSTYCYYSIKEKKNFLDFDTIFILLYAVIGFAYSVFIYDVNEPFSIAFSLSFDVNFIPTGTILFVIGIQSYFWGSLIVREKPLAHKQLDLTTLKPINNTLFSAIVILLSVTFVLSGGVQYYRSIYFYNNTAPETGLTLQIMSLLHSFAVTAIATEFYNKVIDKSYRLNPLLVVAITIIIFLMLYAGNRTLSSQLALPILGLYTMFFKDIGKLKIFLFALIATLFMWMIQFSRVGASVESVQNGAEIIRDLTIPTRSTYSCMEYIQQYGYTFGMNMIGGIIGVVPSLERYLVLLFGLDPRSIGSAEVLTDFTLGPDPFVGLGTNIIADIFLSFGFFGVLFLMFFLGYFVNVNHYKAKLANYYSIIIYASMMSYSVFLVRSTYTHPFRLIVWSLILGVLNKSISQKLFDKSE
jgi:oligosaccharide repeat unit polymerase